MNENSTFENVFVPSMLAAGGNMFGGAINYFTNKQLQEQQFENQKSLQDRAYAMNERAVQRQAQNQVNSMQNAGLNPAAVNGQGAPSIQAGAAAGSTSQFANIFNGLAELITAAKAPTEIEKMVAETGKTTAETGLTKAQTSKTETEIPNIIANTEKLQKEADKIFEETVSAHNANTIWESTNNFYKSFSNQMFDTYKAKLEKAGVWETLSERTKDTIQGIIDGEIQIDMGGIEALTKLIATQKDMSDTDKTMLLNALEGSIINKQLQDPKVMDALAKVPENELKSMQENWKSQRSQRALNASTMKTQKFQRAKLKVDAIGKNIENLQKELDDFNYLYSQGRYKEAGMQLLRNLGYTVQKAVPAATGAAVGAATGGPAGAVTGATAGAFSSTNDF